MGVLDGDSAVYITEDQIKFQIRMYSASASAYTFVLHGDRQVLLAYMRRR